MNKFLKDGIRPDKNVEVDKERNESFQEVVDIPQIKKAEINLDNIKGEGSLSTQPVDTSSAKAGGDQESLTKMSVTSQISGTTDTNPPRKKAKQMRIEKKKAKLESKGQNWEPKQKTSMEKAIRDFVDDINENDCHKLKVSNLDKL